MKIGLHTTRWLLPLLLGIALYESTVYKEYFFWIMGLSTLGADILLHTLFKRDEKKSLVFSITFPSLLLTVLSFSYLLFVESHIVLLAVIATHTLLQYIFIWNSYFFLHRIEKYQKRALPHVTGYMNTLNVFYLSAALFGINYFLNIPLWYLIPLFLAGVYLICLQTFWIQDLKMKKYGWFVLIILIILTEMVATLALLPSIYYINAFVVAIAYFICINLGILALTQELRKREIIRNIIISLVVLLLVMITARWR